jgi:GT2 family glycosyltransferase
MNTCPLSVVIPTYKRPDQLWVALEKIFACNPAPAEVIIHIDANDTVTEPALHCLDFQSIRLIQSSTQMGPGGGRNCAIALATHELVASFDDDSYPIDADYFSRLMQLFAQFPTAAVIGAAIYHQNEVILPDELSVRWDHAFVGCGCAYRKSAFQQTTGYVPLAVAYGMEEVDLSLRLQHLNWQILNSPWLRVFHDTQLEHHNTPKVTAASIANLALLAYLRYPVTFWWLGVIQCLNRILWLLRHGRLAGIVQGIFTILPLISQHRQLRDPISIDALQAHLRLHKRGSPTVPGKNLSQTDRVTGNSWHLQPRAGFSYVYKKLVGDE